MKIVEDICFFHLAFENPQHIAENGLGFEKSSIKHVENSMALRKTAAHCENRFALTLHWPNLLTLSKTARHAEYGLPIPESFESRET